MSNAAGDYANILNMITSGWGSQVTPFDIGLDLGPRDVNSAFQLGSSVLQKRRELEAQRQAEAWRARNEADKTSAGLDIADASNQLGYAKLGSEQEVARIGQEGRIGAAQAKGALDTWRVAQQEQGRNDRASGRVQNQLQMKNQDLFMKQMLADKGVKFPPADIFNQLVMSAKQQFPKATPEEHQVHAIKMWTDLNSALAPEYRRPPAGAEQQPGQQATTRPSPTAGPEFPNSPSATSLARVLNAYRAPASEYDAAPYYPGP